MRGMRVWVLSFVFSATTATEIYTLSLHDALPISCRCRTCRSWSRCPTCRSSSRCRTCRSWSRCPTRSEEHTSELQSHVKLVCRLLLEKKKTPPPSLLEQHPPSALRTLTRRQLTKT